MSEYEFKDIILKLRNELGFNQEQMAKSLNVAKSTVAMWETGKRKPSDEKYEEIADYFNVDMDFLYGRSDIKKKIHYDKNGNEYILSNKEGLPDNLKIITLEPGVKIPVLDRVAAEYGKEAIEEIIGEIEITKEMASKGEHFGLIIKGDSMEPMIRENDTVVVQRDCDFENGDFVIALVNGSDATCKRLQKYSDGIALIPNNPIYEPLRFTAEEMEHTPVKIWGKVVELRRKF